jgi:hypothetical protein
MLNTKLAEEEAEGEYNMMTVIHLTLNTGQIPLQQFCCK